MNKNSLNKFFRKFGFEIHGIGYVEKLRNSTNDKDEWKKQKELLNGKADTIFDVGANIGTSATNNLSQSNNSFIWTISSGMSVV